MCLLGGGGGGHMHLSIHIETGAHSLGYPILETINISHLDPCIFINTQDGHGPLILFLGVICMYLTCII